MVSTSETIQDQIVGALHRLLQHTTDAHGVNGHTGDMTTAQLACLRELVQQDNLTQTQLAERVHLSPSTLVGIIDRLEVKGLVQRHRDLADRRRIHVHATATGTETASSAAEILEHRLADKLAGVELRQQEAMAAALQQLAAILD